MLCRPPAVVLQWVILTHRKQVILYHVYGGFDVNRDWAVVVVQLSYVCNRVIVSADLFCLLRCRLNPYV